MSKNITLKGLAVGAGLALVGTSLVATPASANSTLMTLTPVTGTSASVLTTSSFELLTGFDVSVTSAALLKYKVTNSAGTTVSVRTSGAAAYAAATFRDPGTATTIGAAGDVSATSFVVVPAAAASLGNTNQIELSVSERDVNVNLQVQAFLDTDGNNDISANEAISAPFAISYVDSSSVTASVVLTDPALGTGSLSSSVSLSGNLNLSQLDADDVAVEFLAAGTVIPSFTAGAGGPPLTSAGVAVVAGSNTTTANATRAAWSATDSELRATFTPTDIIQDLVNDAGAVATPLVVAANVVYGAQAKLLTTGTTYANSGSAMFKSATAGQVASLTAVAAVKGPNVSTADLRVGDGSFSVTTTVTPTGTNSKAGQTVTFTIEENAVNSLHSAATVTAGGKTLTNSNAATSQKITVDVVSDADGKATLAIAYTGLRNTNAIKIQASAKGAAATVTSGAATVFTAATSATADVIDLGAVGGNAGSGPVRNITQGGSVSIQYRIVDQFGQTPAGEFRLVITEDSTSAVFSSTLAVVNGAATLNYVDNSSTNNNYLITATVQLKNETTGVWEALAVPKSVTSSIRVAAAQSVTAVTLTPSVASTSSSRLALTNLDLVTADLRVLKNSVAAPAYAAPVTTLGGTVTGANGAAQSGQVVTLSAPGVMFRDRTTNVHSVGSITLLTNENGAWDSVGVYSNKAGSQVITVTSGTATTTLTVWFAEAAVTAGSAWTITSPASVKPGSTFSVTAKLVDKWGNPVAVAATGVTPKVTVSYTGPGFPVSSLPSSTSATGELTFGVLLGTNDSGTATVNVTYDADGGAAVSTTDAVTSAKSITIGSSAATATQGTSVKRTGNTVAVRVTGANARIVLNGVRVASRSTEGVLTRTLTLRAGRNVIQLVVGGEVIRTVRYTR